MLKETKMKKVKAKLKENYSFSQTDTERLVDGNFNISKIEDPIEFKRLAATREANDSPMRVRMGKDAFNASIPVVCAL